MIPLRDVIQTRTFPFVTIALIVSNAVAFLFELSIPDSEMPAFLRAFALVPAHFNWLTLFTSMFLHGGWLHFLGNMLYLWIFGDNVEERLGHAVFVIFYFVCGAAAGLAHALMNTASLLPTMGASGAIAGVMGAYFVLYPQSRILTLIFFGFFYRVVEVPAVVLLGLWFVMQFFSGALSTGAESGGVAFWAHVAGFVAGICWVFIFRNRQVSWNDVQ